MISKITHSIVNKIIMITIVLILVTISVICYSFNQTSGDFLFFIGTSLFVLLIFILFSIYIRRLLSPLKQLRKILNSNNSEVEYYFPFSHRKDEIGLIALAFNAMQIRTLQYSQQQQNINENLAKKIAEKTEELRHQLYYDKLTNLPNRKSLIEAINAQESATLLIINIDDFKEINDFFGHQAGDRLLYKFAFRLQSEISKYPLIRLYRLNGDEFSMMFNTTMSTDTLKEFTTELLTKIEKMRFILEDNEVRVRVSIGASLQMDSALEKADMALKKARQKKQSCLLYDERYSIEKEYQTNLEWVSKIKNAIAYDMIIPFYQPIFDNTTEKVISYESLIRLKDGNGKIITPYHFLDIAKKSRLYPELTKIMIEKSCQRFSKSPSSFSINLSYQDILNPKITLFIKDRIRHYGVAKRIIFEILESEGIDNYEEVSHFIQEVRNLGAKVAIDDFGSGYSNYEYLLKFQIDFIKIDGSLIKNLDNDPNARIIVQTILDFAQKLGIQTIAEYVHNQAILNDVKKLGINRSQGFFLGKPQEQTL